MMSSAENKLRDAYDQIVALIQEGRHADAEASAQEILKSRPDEANFLRLSGVARLRQGRYDDALTQLLASVRSAPEHIDTHTHLGVAFAALGRMSDAEESLRAALLLDPNNESALMKLSRLQSLQGHEEEAHQTRNRIIELNPRWRTLQDAMKLQADGSHDEARKRVKNLLREDPDDVNALHYMGDICMSQGAHNDAEAFLRKAVKLAPDFAAAWNSLSISLKEQGKFAAAAEALEKGLQLEPRNADWHSSLGNYLLAWGKEEEALAAFEKALDIVPGHAGALHSKGHVLKTLGNHDEAIRAYRAAAKGRPELGEIYWSLANLKTFRFDAEEVEFMQSQIESGDLTTESTLNFCYAMGKYCEDQDDYPKAFEYYSRGAALKREIVSYDPVEFSYQTDKIIDVFSSSFFEERASFGYKDPAPILIVGLPRSGSTLIEQILSSHSQVDGTAELSDLLKLGHSTGLNRFDKLKYPESLVDLDADNIEDLGRAYIEQTLHHRQGAPYFTDKMPNNFPHIGFLHLILPNSKVIDARRHPLDSCFGTFKQLFAKGQPFSYDLFELGQYYNNYVRLMEHWDEVLPGKVLRVQYEDNVADQETEARRMIEHCGLDWEDRVLRFYETERAVKTASSEQVRQPIYSKSVNSWKHYENELDDLILVLEDVLDKLPDHLERPARPD